MSSGDDDLSFEELEPTLKNVCEQTTLKWVFVGGKGGVGKTTTSSSLAILLSQVRKNVLLISTDPAHNLSDAFSQKFTKEPTLVNGTSNLFVMEVDPELPEQMGGDSEFAGLVQNPLVKKLASAFPGIDEAMSFAQVLKLVKSLEFDVVVFDTAPTGHTLRLLSFPSVLEKGISALSGMTGKLSGMMNAMGGLFGGGTDSGAAGGLDEKKIANKLQETQATIAEVNKQFQDPDLTTFVCVMIPEFLSLYETERMIQQLSKFGIDSHNIVINQMIFPSTQTNQPCQLCNARRAMQQKYILQAQELYEDFHLVQMPLLHQEVRGIDALRNFAKNLMVPYSSTSTSSTSTSNDNSTFK